MQLQEYVDIVQRACHKNIFYVLIVTTAYVPIEIVESKHTEKQYHSSFS